MVQLKNAHACLVPWPWADDEAQRAWVVTSTAQTIDECDEGFRRYMTQKYGVAANGEA